MPSIQTTGSTPWEGIQQGQVDWGLQQCGLAEGVPAHGSPGFRTHLATLSPFPRAVISSQCSLESSRSPLHGTPAGIFTWNTPLVCITAPCVTHSIATLSRHSYTTRGFIQSNKQSPHAHTLLLQKQRMIQGRKY